MPAVRFGDDGYSSLQFNFKLILPKHSIYKHIKEERDIRKNSNFENMLTVSESGWNL